MRAAQILVNRDHAIEQARDPLRNTKPILSQVSTFNTQPPIDFLFPAMDQAASSEPRPQSVDQVIYPELTMYQESLDRID